MSLLKLYALRQPLLSRSTTDALDKLCTASSSHLSTQNLADLLNRVVNTEPAWDRKDADAVLALTMLLERGFTRCGSLMLRGIRHAYGQPADIWWACKLHGNAKVLRCWQWQSLETHL